MFAKNFELLTEETEPKQADRLRKAQGLMVYPRKPIEESLTWMITSRPQPDKVEDYKMDYFEKCVKTWDKIKRPTIVLFEKYCQKATQKESKKEEEEKGMILMASL